MIKLKMLKTLNLERTYLKPTKMQLKTRSQSLRKSHEPSLPLQLVDKFLPKN